MMRELWRGVIWGTVVGVPAGLALRRYLRRRPSLAARAYGWRS
jgi:hypothetical protein